MFFVSEYSWKINSQYSHNFWNMVEEAFAGSIVFFFIQKSATLGKLCEKIGFLLIYHLQVNCQTFEQTLIIFL